MVYLLVLEHRFSRPSPGVGRHMPIHPRAARPRSRGTPVQPDRPKLVRHYRLSSEYDRSELTVVRRETALRSGQQYL